MNPTEDEIEEERVNRKATFLAAIARMISLRQSGEDFHQCKIQCLAMFFRNGIGADSESMRSAIEIAIKLSKQTNRISSFLEPYANEIVRCLCAASTTTTDMDDQEDEDEEPFQIADFFHVLEPCELIESGIFECFVIFNLELDSKFNVIELEQEFATVDGIAMATKRIQTIAKLRNIPLSGRTTVENSKEDLWQWAEDLARIWLISPFSSLGPSDVHKIISFWSGSSQPASLLQICARFRGFLPRLLAAIDSRLKLTFDFSSSRPIETVRVFSEFISYLLAEKFTDQREADYLLTFCFKMFTNAMSIAVTSHFAPCDVENVEILLIKVIEPIVRQHKFSNASFCPSVRCLVAPLVTTLIAFFESNDTHLTEPLKNKASFFN